MYPSKSHKAIFFREAFLKKNRDRGFLMFIGYFSGSVCIGTIVTRNMNRLQMLDGRPLVQAQGEISIFEANTSKDR